MVCYNKVDIFNENKIIILKQIINKSQYSDFSFGKTYKTSHIK